ncbi:MAG: hypothetical protein EBS29_12755 [Chloroflexia bacterium]|nr:hypothetical protein [Chloroflexia bacterium]
MNHKQHHTWIERFAEKIGLIPNLHTEEETMEPRLMPEGQLRSFPPPEKWDDWVEYEAKAWPKISKKRYTIVPTTCFNCEAACGLVAYVDKADGKIRKVEGNPVFIYHDMFNPDVAEVNDLKDRYRTGNVGDVEVKKKLAIAINNFLEPMRERRAVYVAKPKLVDEILAAGNAKTRKIAQETVRMMDDAMGLLYFKN